MKKKKKDKITSESKKSVAKISAPSEEKPFEFGGLPNRDLKKNLGCG